MYYYYKILVNFLSDEIYKNFHVEKMQVVSDNTTGVYLN